jgi:peptidoglycan/xylan/chitin deacetylase (PgdA/CDA1 family)
MSESWPLVLAYHHLDATASSRYVLPVARFERQLSAMLDDGFTPLALPDAVAAGPFGRGDAAPKTFTLTFDDALVSFHDLAVPVLERLGLLHAATVFVPTAFVGRDNAWREQPTLLQRLVPWSEVAEGLLTWERIAECAAAGVRFESHGHAHAAMQTLTYDDALADVRTSLALLAEHCVEARYFALPFGWRSEACKQAIRDAGLDAAFSVKRGGRDRFEIRRVPMYGSDAPTMLWLKLSGRYFDVFDATVGLAGRRG